LRLKVKVPFANIDQVMLCGIAQAIDCLKRQRLFVRQKLNFGRRECTSNASVETDSVLVGSSFANASSSMENCRFQEHFKGVIEKHENRVSTSNIRRAVEVFDAQD
jgi:hypothetical protein